MTRLVEYHNPNDPEGSPVVQEGRDYFRDSIEKVAPEVLASLQGDVLPKFREVRTACGDQWITRSWSVLQHTAEKLRTEPDLAAALAQTGMVVSPLALADAVQAWATLWNLTDEWIVDDALSTMQWWMDYRPGAHWRPGGMGMMVLQLPVPACESFEPNRESWAMFERRVKDWMQRNREAAPRAAAEAGLVPASEHRVDPMEYFEWLVCWQVQRWTYAKIAERYRGDESTIRRKVKESAALIRLTKRTQVGSKVTTLTA